MTAKQELLILNCTDSRMWYSNLVGERVLFIRDTGYDYLSREPAGYTNIVLYKDAVLVDILEEDQDE